MKNDIPFNHIHLLHCKTKTPTWQRYDSDAACNKMSMVNVLTVPAYTPWSIYNVVDCSYYMIEGCIEDAYYLYPWHMPLMEKSKEENTFNDLKLFNGSRNMEKRGNVIAAKSPKITVVYVYVAHQYAASLFFGGPIIDWLM